MRRIYAIAAVVLIGLAFWVGYRIGRPDMDKDGSELKALNRKYDSLSGELGASKRREAFLRGQAEKDVLAIEEKETQLAAREKSHQNKSRKYEKRIIELESYRTDQLDTFFINRYPGTGHAKDPALESDTSRAGAGKIRLVENGDAKTEVGLQGHEIYCRTAEAPYTFTERDLGGAGEPVTYQGGANDSSKSEGGVLAASDQEIQTPTEFGNDWNGGIDRWGNLLLP
jgi:hypothetical protein